MDTREFATFLDEITARLGLRAAGYRRVKKTVEKRVSRRLRVLGLRDLAGYRVSWSLRARFRAGVRFELGDLRRTGPDGPFELILCRNSAFTYFDAGVQQRVAAALEASTQPGSLVVLGAGERLPDSATGFRLREPGIYSRVEPAGAPPRFASA